MRIRPLRTVPLRSGLVLSKHRNAFSRRRLDALERKFSPWSNPAGVPAVAASISSTIHPYPGIGHQLAGWISGQLWARDLGLSYTGGRITRDESGLFEFPIESALPAPDAARYVRLASVNDERDVRSLTVLRGQVNRALEKTQGAPVHFLLALDQARWDQTPSAGTVRSAVAAGSYGLKLAQIEAEAEPYIAMHVRRGDVGQGAMGGSTGQSRWIDENWYVTLLRRLRRNRDIDGMEVRVYSLGEPKDFPLLQREGVTLCLNRDRDLDFIELCAARILVVAPSSFSFTAGLASRGVVIARHPWWHHVPEGGSWVRADSAGEFSMATLEDAFRNGV